MRATFSTQVPAHNPHITPKCPHITLHITLGHAHAVRAKLPAHNPHITLHITCAGYFLRGRCGATCGCARLGRFEMGLPLIRGLFFTRQTNLRSFWGPKVMCRVMCGICSACFLMGGDLEFRPYPTSGAPPPPTERTSRGLLGPRVMCRVMCGICSRVFMAGALVSIVRNRM